MPESGSIPFRSRVKTEDLPPATVFLDTETYTDGEYQKLLLGCFEYFPTNRWGLPDKRHQVHRGIFRTEVEFYDLLKSWGACRVVAHNWQFDAAVLRLGALSAMEAYGYVLDPEQGIYPVGGSGFSPFWITLAWEDGTRAEFICNTNFHKTSLAKLGESFGLDKLTMPTLGKEFLAVEIPHELKRWVYRNDSDCIQDTGQEQLDQLLRMVKYCKRDVEILRRSWFSLFEFTKRYGVTPGLTVASMGQRVYAKHWFPRLPPGLQVVGNRDVPALNEPEREAYKGGRVEVFYQGTPKGVTLNKYDANSMYPSVMQGPVPVQFCGLCTPAKLLWRLDLGLDAAGINLADVTVTIPEDGLGWLGWEGIRDPDRGLIFPVGTFRTWAWTPLLRIAHRYGWIKTVHACFDYHALPIFNPYVRDVYKLRKEAKLAGDKPTALLYKYLLNSVYGKFGQGNYGSWEPVEGKEADWQAHCLDTREHCRWFDYPCGNMDHEPTDYWYSGGTVYRWREPEDGMGKRSVCSIAGYITSKARAKLLETMHTLHKQGSNVFMCDTDSIVTDGTLPASMVGNSLGAWELEDTSPGEECEFSAPKHYSFNQEHKCKGIRNPQRGISTYVQAQFSKWTTDLMNHKRRERLEHGAMVRDVTKTVTGVNSKRISRGKDAFNGPIVVG